MSDPATFAVIADYQETGVGTPGKDQGWRFTLTLRVKSGFQDAMLFRYQKISAEEVMFTGVCSPADLADYGPVPRTDNGFFRAATATLDFAARSDAYEVRDAVLNEIEVLCGEMSRISDNMTPVQSIEISSNPSTNVDPQ
jgi:hypothetical protein